MKYFGNKLTVIFILVLTIAATSTSQTQEKWNLEISLEKNSFLLREPIWLDAVLTNVSDDTLRLWGLLPPCQGTSFCVELTDSLGNSVPYSGPLYDLGRLEGFLIFQYEQYYNCFNLLDIFGGRYISTYDFPALTPGTYYVQGEYLGILSDKISFVVIDLTGKEEEKEAERSIIEAYKKDFRRSESVAQPALSKTFESYPNSVYTEIIALNILGYSDFLNRFPNSGHTRTRLTGDMMGLTDEEKIEYLENAIIKYKGTRAARHAEQLLRLQRK